MKISKVKLADLREPEWNYRIHNDSQIAEFVRSLDMFGQIRPIIVDEDNMVLVGNGLVKAMLSRGDVKADALVITDLTDKQKKKLCVADNKIFGLGRDDKDLLTGLLKDITSDGEFEVPGFEADVLEQLFMDAEGITEEILNQYKDDTPETKSARERDYMGDEEEGDEEAPYIVCPHCGEKILC